MVNAVKAVKPIYDFLSVVVLNDGTIQVYNGSEYTVVLVEMWAIDYQRSITISNDIFDLIEQGESVSFKPNPIPRFPLNFLHIYGRINGNSVDGYCL